MWAGREFTPTSQGKQNPYLVPMKRRGVWLRYLIQGTEWGGEPVAWPFEALLIFPDIKTALNIESSFQSLYHIFK